MPARVWKIRTICENLRSFFAPHLSLFSIAYSPAHSHCRMQTRTSILAFRAMKRRTVWLLGGLILCSLLLIAYLRHKYAQPPAAAIPELLLQCPADASFLFYVDLAALRASPFLKQLLAVVPAPAEDPEYREFVRATDFDYSRDLDRVLLLFRPAPNGRSLLAWADGRFDRERIAAYALRTGKLEQREGTQLYLIPAGKPPATISLAFLGPNRLVLAQPVSFRMELLRTSAPALSPAQRERFVRVAGAAFIAASAVDASRQDFAFFGIRSRELKDALRNIHWITFAARPDGDRIKISVEGEFDTPESARGAARAVDSFRLLARLLLLDSRVRSQLTPQALALADRIARNGEVLQEGVRVHLRMEIAAEELLAPAPSAPSK